MTKDPLVTVMADESTPIEGTLDRLIIQSHPQFLENRASFKYIHGYNWQTQAERPILANFLGSKDPRIRERVLDSIPPMLAPDGARDSTARPGKQWFWHEYTDAAPGGLGPLEFVDLLTNSDFTLCPPRYSLVTHRPIEALLRDSIPVLNANELDIYAIGLADGVNCIAAPIGDWSTVIDRLLAIDQDRIAAMRRGEVDPAALKSIAGCRSNGKHHARYFGPAPMRSIPNPPPSAGHT